MLNRCRKHYIFEIVEQKESNGYLAKAIEKEMSPKLMHCKRVIISEDSTT